MLFDQVKSNDSIGFDNKMNKENHEGSTDNMEDLSENSIKTTIITDINIDCLESIFGYLDLRDLLSVSDSNKYLKGGADLIFARKYGKQKIRLDLFDHSPASPVSEQMSEITISGLKTCLQILRCFGHLISNLHITGDRFVLYGIKENTIRLIDYMARYCSKFVTEITFEKLSEAALVHIKDEFPAVETVRYKYCDVKKGFAQLNQVFPKTRLLELLWTDVIDMKIHMPNLVQLVIDLPINLSALQKEHIETMIQLNPQLYSLKMYFFWNIEFLRNISKHFDSLENLEIVCDFSDSHIYNEGKIHFNGVKNFTVRSIAIPRVTFSFDRLESFTLDTNCWWTEANINLIKKHSSITKLITGQTDSRFRFIINDEIAREMANALQTLKELAINYKEISVGEAICVLKCFETLDRIQFTMENSTDFDVLSTIINGKWAAKVSEGNNVQFDRIFKLG